MEAGLRPGGRVADQHVGGPWLGGGRPGDLAGGARAAAAGRGRAAVGLQFAGQAGESGFGAGRRRRVHLPGGEGPGDVLPDAVRGAGDDGVARFRSACSPRLPPALSGAKMILLQDDLNGRR